MEIPPVLENLNGTTPAEAKNPAGSIQLQQDFMALLVESMKDQDPFATKDHGEFLAQLAQFSSLEQSENLNQTMLAVAQIQSDAAGLQQLTAGSALIGREIDFIGEDGSIDNGVVESVIVGSEGTFLKVGTLGVPLGAVVEVKEQAKSGESGSGA